MEEATETNTLAAAVLFLASIVADAFTAHDPMTPREAPTALRTTAIILIACLAAPPIRQWMVFEQRIAIAIPLGLVAIVGWHEHSYGTRVADALYTTIALSASVFNFWGGGEWSINASDKDGLRTKSNDAPSYLKREAVANLSVTMLFYSSLRMLRAALSHPSTVRDFKVATLAYDNTNQASVGYAYASAYACEAMCFGATAGVGVSIVLLGNKELRTRGTSAATLVLTTSAFAQLLGAFVASMASSEQMDNLPAIFSAGGCADRELCEAAWLARRFAVVNQIAGGLWLNGLGTLLLAFAPDIRLRSRAEAAEVTRNFEMVVYAGLATLVALGTLFAYLSFDGADALTDYACVGAVAAVMIAAFGDSLVGSALFLICISADIFQLWISGGFVSVFGNFTHCCNGFLLLLLLFYVILTTITDFTWRWIPTRVVDTLDTMNGVVAVMGTSVATALYCGTAALIMSYDGQHIADEHIRVGGNRFPRTAAAMIVEHWLPLLIWLPLYACKCEVEQLDRVVRSVAWYLSPLVPIISWMIILSTSSQAANHAHGWYSSEAFIVSVIVATVAPWLAVPWA